MSKLKFAKPKKPQLHVVSLSGGKDSTAMLLRMIEEGMKIDIILFCDTGLEFPAMYRHLDKVEKDTGAHITRICANHDFEHMLLHHEIMVKKNGEHKQHRGFSWPGPHYRWCTRDLKERPREAFLRPLQKKYDIIEYVGIAADEGYRLERKNNQQENVRHPLVDWGMTEADCLQYCYDHGYDWEGLYHYFDRVSCWCCPLQPLADLRQLYEHFPELWAQLKEWDEKTWRSFKADFTVEQLAKRFDLEKAWQAEGKDINSKEFHTELQKIMEEETCTKK